MQYLKWTFSLELFNVLFEIAHIALFYYVN